MGMDVVGLNATSETGRYFRSNVRWWCPLASYACGVAPEATSACKSWYLNEGDGLDAASSVALANKLEAEIKSGRCATYARLFLSELAMTPLDICHVCHGSGMHKQQLQWGAGGPMQGGIKCKGCNGKGYVRSLWTLCSFSVENVRKFVSFLRDCGGFVIC